MPVELVRHLTPAEEMIKDLNMRLHEMAMEANADIEREKARSQAWCDDRWHRMHMETAAMRAQRDQLLRAWAEAQPGPPVPVEPPKHHPYG